MNTFARRFALASLLLTAFMFAPLPAQEITATTEQVNALTNQAAEQIKRKEFAAALESCNKLLLLKPSNSGLVYLLRGIAYRSLQKKDLALADFSYAATLLPDNINALKLKALTNFELRNWEQAAQDYSAVLKLEPREFQTLFMRARAYQATKAYKLAIADYTEFLEVAPEADKGRIASYTQRAACRLELGDYENAVKDAGEGLKMNPAHMLGYEVRAKAYRALKKDDLALADEQKLAELRTAQAASKPASAADVRWLELANSGLEKHKKGDNVGAIEDFTAALEIKPSAALYFARGREFQNTGKPDKALADYNQAIKLDAKYADVYIFRGQVFISQGKIDEAIQDANEALKLNPQAALALDVRAAGYRRKNAHELAIKDASEALRLKPGLSSAYFNRAFAYDALEKYDEALADLNVILKETPDWADALFLRSSILFIKKGDNNAALRDLEVLTKAHPDYAAAYVVRGSIRLTTGEWQKAIDDYTEALRLDSTLKESYKGRAFAYRQLGKIVLAELDEDKVKAAQPIPKP
jgi:tetratricopeptide (TPR) repeat protein